MKTKILLLLVVIASIASFSFYNYKSTPEQITQVCCGQTEEGWATCTGSKSCTACKNCKYCKHCAKKGGTCGVCK